MQEFAIVIFRKRGYWKVYCGFVCRIEVVIKMIMSITMNINNEKQNPFVSFPAGEHLADDGACRRMIVMRIKSFGPHLNANSLRGIIAEDLSNFP